MESSWVVFNLSSCSLLKQLRAVNMPGGGGGGDGGGGDGGGGDG